MADDATSAAAVAAGAGAGAGVMDLDHALPEMLKQAMIADGLLKGIREVCKALDRREAHLCLLAEDCDEENYKTLVEALCYEHDIPFIKISDRKKLGEWLGTCKIDKEGKARKVVGCSSCVIREYGQPSPARDFVLEYLKTRPREERVIRATTAPSADKGKAAEKKAPEAEKKPEKGKKKK